MHISADCKVLIYFESFAVDSTVLISFESCTLTPSLFACLLCFCMRLSTSLHPSSTLCLKMRLKAQAAVSFAVCRDLQQIKPTGTANIVKTATRCISSLSQLALDLPRCQQTLTSTFSSSLQLLSVSCLLEAVMFVMQRPRDGHVPYQRCCPHCAINATGRSKQWPGHRQEASS